MTYLDHNATSPLLPQARAAWLEAVEQLPGNPSSPHRIGARADRALEEARQRLATMLGCQPLDLVWTSGATEACNSVLHHAAATAGTDAEAWVSAIEHPAVRESAGHFFRGRIRTIPVDRRGIVELEWLEKELARKRPAVVAIMAANNETGGLQLWREAQAICAAREAPFFCDATQWCGRLPVRGLGACDFVAGSAHKFGGPRGVGFLKMPGAGKFIPLLHGGPQQERRRAGTENVPAIVAAMAALEWCEQQLATGAVETRRRVREKFERELCAAVPGLTINGGEAERLWNTVSVVMPATAEARLRWVVKLDKAGLAVSTGSACASGSEEPSPVLTAMGLDADKAARALRFSSGWLTPDAAWDELRGAIEAICREVA